MLAFALRRTAGLAVTLAVATLVIFAVLQIVPGDPAAVMLGINADESALAALRERLGLDQPAWWRYLDWVGGLVTGDLGTSYPYSVPVSELVADRVMVSVPLALMALALSTAISIPLGAFAATRRGKPSDAAVMGATQIGIAVPNFWFALMLVYVFAVTLRLFPSGGFPGWGAGAWPAFRALILPAVALALPQAAILARVARSAMLEVLGEDYIRTARAKGLTWSAAVWRHGLRNALIPVVTILGLQFAFLLAGTIIIENVFYLPGLGRLVFQAITQRDLIVVQGLIVLLVGAVVVVNFLVDLAYGAIDPRMRSAR
ncbi:MAG: ABC transporter permease [Flavobacteriaceae bacterium]